MAFTTMQQILDASPGQRIDFFKSLNSVTGGWASAWTVTGQPAAGAAPSSGAAGDIPTISTLGTLPYVAAGSGGLYLARWDVTVGSNTPCMVVLYDRLWQNSGIDATSTGAQTVNSTALTRPDANGAQAEVWWQVYATMGAGTPAVTLTYTNQGGTGSRSGSSGTLPTAMANQRTGPFALDSGDTGVRSIQSWQADATFTSGTIGLVLRRRLAEIYVDRSAQPVNDVLRSIVAKIPAGACLEFVVFSSFGDTANPSGAINIVEG